MAECDVVEGRGCDDVRKVRAMKMRISNKDGKRSSPVQYSEVIFDEDTYKEIESFLKQKLVREKEVSQDDVLQTQYANEQIADDNHAILIEEKGSSLSEKEKCMQIETRGCEKQIEVTEASPRKHVHNDGNEKIDYDVGIVAKNVGMNSVEEVEHSDDLSESKTGEQNNPNVVHTKVNAAETKPLKVPLTKTTSIGSLWNDYVLAVRGIPPSEVRVS
jgi:hypothetical protein